MITIKKGDETLTDKTFDGKSAKGDFQAALSDAIDNAQQSTGVADELVKWKLQEVKGERGGIAGLNNITVTIQASFSSQSKR